MVYDSLQTHWVNYISLGRHRSRSSASLTSRSAAEAKKEGDVKAEKSSSSAADGDKRAERKVLGLFLL